MPTAPTSRPAYSLVIPLYNEADSLRPLWAEIVPVMQGLGKAWEVIFVDDGSKDGSDKLLAQLAAENANVQLVSFRHNRGKAAGLQAGFKEASGDILITLDADLQDDPAEIPNLIEAINAGSDLVVGYKKNRHDPIHKTVPSRVFNAMIRQSSGLDIHDVNCGLKAYRREVSDSLRVYGELYRLIPVMAASQGFRVSELAVNHRPRQHGVSKYGASRFLRGFLDLLTVVFITKFLKRPLHFFGSFGVFLMLAGVAIRGCMTVLHYDLHERVGGRPLLIFGVLFIIAGFQAISTGLIAELITYYAQERESQR